MSFKAALAPETTFECIVGKCPFSVKFFFLTCINTNAVNTFSWHVLKVWTQVSGEGPEEVLLTSLGNAWKRLKWFVSVKCSRIKTCLSVLCLSSVPLTAPKNLRVSEEWYNRFRISWDVPPSPTMGYRIVYQPVSGECQTWAQTGVKCTKVHRSVSVWSTGVSISLIYSPGFSSRSGSGDLRGGRREHHADLEPAQWDGLQREGHRVLHHRLQRGSDGTRQNTSAPHYSHLYPDVLEYSLIKGHRIK